jgi:hypothetical protein
VSIKRRLSARVIEENKDSSLSSIPSDFEGEEDDDEDRNVINRKPGLRLARGNLAEGANPDADGSKTGESMDVNTPVSGLILIKYNTTEEYDADKDKTYKSDKNNKNINENGRPIKKRKRDIILLR